MIYSVDRDGWGSVFADFSEAENSLEWLDVSHGEYRIVDDAGFIIEWHESDTGYYGYRLRRSASSDLELLKAIQEQLSGAPDTTDFRLTDGSRS